MAVISEQDSKDETSEQFEEIEKSTKDLQESEKSELHKNEIGLAQVSTKKFHLNRTRCSVYSASGGEPTTTKKKI